MVGRDDLQISYQFPSRASLNSLLCSPTLQRDKVRTDDGADEFPCIAHERHMPDERRQFQLVFDWLRRDELAPAGLDKVLLAIGDAEKAVGINVPNVSRFEPVAFECVRGLFRILPIAFEDRRSANQQFTVFGDAAFDVIQWLAYSSELVCVRFVYRNHRRGFG